MEVMEVKKVTKGRRGHRRGHRCSHMACFTTRQLRQGHKDDDKIRLGGS